MSALPVPDLPSDQSRPDTQSIIVAEQSLDRGHGLRDAHTAPAPVDHSSHLGQGSPAPHGHVAEVGTFADRAQDHTEPTVAPPDQHHRGGHTSGDAQSRGAVVARPDQGPCDAQASFVGAGSLSPSAGSNLGPPPIQPPGRPEDVILQITADALDDLEGARIANENRVRSLAQVKDMGDSPEADRMAGIVEGIRDLEHRAELELKRALRKHPLGPWVKATKGLGEKQAGRLLAAIGDPYVRPAFFDENGEEVAPSRPRTVSELWAYCGYHVVRSGHRRHDTHATTAGADSSQGGDAGQGGCEDQQCTAGVAPLRTRGAKANWNKWAKMRAYLVAESCLKQLAKTCVKPDGQAWADHDPERCACSPYRVVYDEGRRKYADAVHQVPCKRCGPSGRPAEVGRPLSDGHKHARALRLVAKTVLKDLWLAARDIHEGKAQGREAA